MLKNFSSHVVTTDLTHETDDNALLKNLSNNVNQLMAKERLTASELGRRIGLPASTIKKVRNCDAPNPTISTLLPIAKYFALTLSELVGDVVMPSRQFNGVLQRIPVLSWDVVINYPHADLSSDEAVLIDPLENSAAYALMVNQSNLEYFQEGTLLMIDPNRKPTHQDLVIVYKTGQKNACLRQWIDEMGEIYLKTLIVGCPFTALTADHQILGVVIECRKRLGSF